MMDASLEDVVREFLKILNKVEVSDIGVESRPNYITSCRTHDLIRMGNLLDEMQRKVSVKT